MTSMSGWLLKFTAPTTRGAGVGAAAGGCAGAGACPKALESAKMQSAKIPGEAVKRQALVI